MDRRHFLRGAGYLSLLTFLQACGLTNLLNRNPNEPAARLSTSMPGTSLPTFTPTATSTPWSTPTQAAPTAIGTATPTETATTEPTPEPTATSSTIEPTPYPPGPPSKLGLFLTQYEAAVFEMLNQAKPALIKTLEIDANFAQGIKDASPNTILVGRIHLDQINLDIDPLPQAQSFVNQLLPLATTPGRLAAFTAWEAYNEPLADTVEKMQRLADFEAERTRLLAENGLRSVVGNFAAGHPPLELWPHFKPALAAIRQYNGYLGLHEYSAPVMQFRAGSLQLNGEPAQGDEGWLTLRYRKAYRNYLTPMGFGDTPCLITECGVDGLVRPRPGPEKAKGWQDFIDTWLANGLRNDPPGVYMDQLIWYDENLQQDDYIKGAAIFLAGTNDSQWNSYNILGPNAGRMLDLLTQYLKVHPPR